MFPLGRQRGRRQADHSVVRRFADTINASIPATNVATAQRRLPLPLTITSAPFLRSDRRDGTPLAARISSRPTKLLRYPELFRCPIARVYQGKGWLYIRCRGIPGRNSGEGRSALCRTPLRNNPFSYRIEDNVRGAVQVKFLHEIGTMAFNSLRAKVQEASNIFIGLAFSN